MARIGIFDSGSGGLSVYRELQKLLPLEQYRYYADNAHCPYGEKSPLYIRRRARFITERFLDWKADIIVVACNTATAAAIATLRNEYPDVPFVGMEPAVKPAALGTETVEHVGQGFVELVERGILDGPEAEETVKASLKPLLDAGADRIVLGCTHYPFLKPVIERLSGPGVQVIDPAPAVARQTLRILQDCGVATGIGPFSIILEASGSPEPLNRIFELI